MNYRYSLFASLLLVTACSKKDDATPATTSDYSTYTAVGGTMAISKNGAASVNLTSLQLRIVHGSSQDSYQYRGAYSSTEGVAITFNVDPKRTTTAATWVGATYTGGFSGSQGSVEGGTGTYANPGASATASFSGAIYKGSLK